MAHVVGIFSKMGIDLLLFYRMEELRYHRTNTWIVTRQNTQKKVERNKSVGLYNVYTQYIKTDRLEGENRSIDDGKMIKGQILFCYYEYSLLEWLFSSKHYYGPFLAKKLSIETVTLLAKMLCYTFKSDIWSVQLEMDFNFITVLLHFYLRLFNWLSLIFKKVWII